MATQTLQLLLGDCLVRLDGLDPESIRAMVSDPPYDLTAVSRGGSPRKEGTGPFGRHKLDTNTTAPGPGGFMGKAWDGTGIAFSQEFWSRVYRVLKPGGVVKAFSGTRTFHRMAAAMEEAGLILEPQESLEAWCYGSGFPKSLNVGKAIAAHKLTGRSDSTVTGDGQARDRSGQHWSEFPTGRTNSPDSKPRDELWDGWHTALKPSWEPVIVGRKPA